MKFKSTTGRINPFEFLFITWSFYISLKVEYLFQYRRSNPEEVSAIFTRCKDAHVATVSQLTGAIQKQKERSEQLRSLVKDFDRTKVECNIVANQLSETRNDRTRFEQMKKDALAIEVKINELRTNVSNMETRIRTLQGDLTFERSTAEEFDHLHNEHKFKLECQLDKLIDNAMPISICYIEAPNEDNELNKRISHFVVF